MARVTGGRTKRDAAKAELHRAHTKDDGSSWTTTMGGFPIRSKWAKAKKKHEKDYPQLVSDIEHESSKIVPPYEEGPHKIKASPQKRGDFKKGGRVKRSTGVATHGFGKEIR